MAAPTRYSGMAAAEHDSNSNSPSTSLTNIANSAPIVTDKGFQEEDSRPYALQTSSSSHSGSRTWVSPAREIRLQRVKEASEPRHMSLDVRGNRDMHKDFRRLRSRWNHQFPGNSAILPQHLASYNLHKRAVALDSQRRWNRRYKARLAQEICQIDSSKDHDLWTNPGLGLPFGGKVFSGSESSVLCVRTIWTNFLSDSSSIWPSAREMCYEGFERQATRESNFHRFLPLARDWRSEAQTLDPRNTGLSVRYWEAFPRLHIHSFDRLVCEQPKSHHDIYPFGIDCPIPECDECLCLQLHYGMIEEGEWETGVSRYYDDISYDSMSRVLSTDLLTAIDSDDF